MRVTRVHESPRVTKPYTEEQWERIDRLGRTIDADLKRQDVRLTMVDGRALYEGGAHTTLELAAVTAEASREARALVQRAGFAGAAA